MVANILGGSGVIGDVPVGGIVHMPRDHGGAFGPALVGVEAARV